jgi:hypothetical protein
MHHLHLFCPMNLPFMCKISLRNIFINHALGYFEPFRSFLFHNQVTPYWVETLLGGYYEPCFFPHAQMRCFFFPHDDFSKEPLRIPLNGSALRPWCHFEVGTTRFDRLVLAYGMLSHTTALWPKISSQYYLYMWYIYIYIYLSIYRLDMSM